MNTSFAFTSGGYFADILAQPAALQNTLDGLSVDPAIERIAHQIAAGRFERIILTGMGSSLHVFHPFQLDLLQRGLFAILLETSELLYYQRQLLTPATLVIAASQSGRSAEILSLLDEFAGKVSLLGITNTAESPLARRADAVVLTRAGEETTVSCKTYVAALLALRWLAEVLVSADPRPAVQECAEIPRLVEGYLARWQQHVLELQPALEGIRQIYFTGRGPSLATVGTAGLTTKESTHFPAEGMSCASFRHGPLEIVGPETGVVIFAGDPRTRALNWRLAEDVRRLDGRLFWVDWEGSSPACTLPQAPVYLQQILEILPVQMITLSLPCPQGHLVGDFRISSKVTSVE